MNQNYDCKKADFIKQMQDIGFTENDIDFVMMHSVALAKCALIDAQNETNSGLSKVIKYL